MKKFLKSAMSVVLGILMASGVLLQGFSQQASASELNDNESSKMAASSLIVDAPSEGYHYVGRTLLDNEVFFLYENSYTLGTYEFVPEDNMIRANGMCLPGDPGYPMCHTYKPNPNQPTGCRPDRDLVKLGKCLIRKTFGADKIKSVGASVIVAVAVAALKGNFAAAVSSVLGGPASWAVAAMVVAFNAIECQCGKG